MPTVTDGVTLTRVIHIRKTKQEHYETHNLIQIISHELYMKTLKMKTDLNRKQEKNETSLITDLVKTRMSNTKLNKHRLLQKQINYGNQSHKICNKTQRLRQCQHLHFDVYSAN